MPSEILIPPVLGPEAVELGWRPVFAAAAQAFAQGDFVRAEAGYREVMLAAPEFIEAHAGAAQCARARGDREAALALFENALALAPDAPWLKLEAASDLRALGRFEAANAAYLNVSEAEPENIHAKAGLAHCARHWGSRAASLALFEEISNIAPQAGWARLEAASDLRELGRVEEAQALYRAVLAIEPGNAYARIGLGQCARLQHDHETALACFRAAVESAPENAWTFIELAGELRELGRIEDAEAVYRALLAREPGNGFAELGLGGCARQRGARGEALAHFETASRLAPAEPWPWIEIATEQRAAGDFETARRTAQTYLDRHGPDRLLLAGIAETERLAGRHEAARDAYAKAHAAYPGDPAILTELAITERRLGHQGKCDQYLAEALALDPLNVPAILCTADQAAISGNAVRAHEIYRAAAAAQPNEIIFELGRLETLAGLGETDAALAGLAALEATHGPVPRMRMLRVNLLRQSGHTHEALALARDSTRIAPHFFWLWVARMHCELLAGTGSAIEACLQAMPATSMPEKATLRRFSGAYAESCWRIDEAIRHFEAAERLNPEDSGVQYDLIRTKILAHDLAGALKHLHKSNRMDAYYTRLRRKSLNASQTHYGQILDDYRLDEEMAATLAQLNTLPPARRATALRGVLRHNPDNTAAAVSLAVALRQSGVFEQRVPEPGQNIPRLITQFWDTPDLPADIASIMESWRQLNPDFTLRRFDDVTARSYLAQRFPPPVLQAYVRTREAAQKADILRLACLTAEGGIYADADDRCLSPIGAFVPADVSVVLYQEDHGTIGNNFIAAAPRHKLLVTALAMAVQAINRGDSDIVWLSTGPGLLTRAFAQILCKRAANSWLPPGTVIYDRRELYLHIAVHCDAAYKKTGKHWSNAAFSTRRGAAEPAGS